MGHGWGARLVVCLVSVLIVVATATNAWGQPSLTLVARSGGPVGGGGGGTFTNGFSGAAVNDAGHVTFRGGVNDGATSSGAIFAGTTGDMQVLIRGGDDAFGIGGGVKYGTVWSDPQIDAAGRVGFTTLLGSTDDAALYTGTSGALTLVARTGATAPGTTAQYAPFFNVALGRGGHVGFGSRLVGTGVTTSNRDALFASATSGGPVSLIARQGAASPLPGNPPYAGVPRDPPAVGGNGHIAFTAAAGGGTSIITGPAAGPMSVLARSGATAPGTTSTFSSFADDLHVDAAGRVAFRAMLSGTNNGVSSPDAFFIGSTTTGVTMLVAREGDAAPDLPAGAFYFQLGTAATRANDAGQLAFRATVAGGGINSTNDQAIFAGAAGGVRLIAQTTDPVPDADPLAPGTPRFFSLSQPLISDDGFVAFHATFDGSLNPPNGIFATDAAGELFTIARSGQQLDIDGTLRTVRDLRLQTEDPNATALSGSAANLVFSATFTDNTAAVFMTTVPEPGGLCVPLLAAAWILRRRRRRRRHPRCLRRFVR